MAIKAVIVDAGGVLLRGEWTGHRRWEERLRLQPGTLIPQLFTRERNALATLGRLSADDLWAQAGAALKIGAADLAALRADYWSQETIDHELTRYLQSLRPRYRVGLLSNAWNDARAAFTQKYHLDKVMDTFVISAEEGMAKPDLRIYRLAAERLEVAPRECIFVDDRAGNVTGAEAAGMKGVVFAATAQAIDAIQYHLGHS